MIFIFSHNIYWNPVAARCGFKSPWANNMRETTPNLYQLWWYYILLIELLSLIKANVVENYMLLKIENYQNKYGPIWESFSHNLTHIMS